MSKVLVIEARGLHLGQLGCYGNDWIETPTIDRLAAEGVVFDQHLAACPDATGAVHSWRTGRQRLPELEPAATTDVPSAANLLDLLSAADVPTILVHDDSQPAVAEFLTGWQEVHGVPAEAGEGTALERSLDAAAAALEKLAGRERWLVWLSLATPLPPWNVPPQFRDRYFVSESPPKEVDDEEEEEDEEHEEEPDTEDPPLEPLPDPVLGPIDPEDDALFLRLRYSSAGAVAYLDAGLELLINHLREQNQIDDLTLIVTTDHGLLLGEHGVVGNVRPWLHEELVHIPLIIRLPGKGRAGRRLTALTQSVDLMPTLLDLFGVTLPQVHGHSLLPLLRGEVEEVRPYAVMGLSQADGVEWALRTLDWAYLLPLRTFLGDPPRKEQLFVKPDDRWEVNDVRQHHLELAEHAEQVLRTFAEAVRRPGPLTYPELRDVEGEADQEPEEEAPK
jgi:arylsulfatase A-like enzyme